MTILDLVQQEIDRVAEEQYSDHTPSSCTPIFTASLYNRLIIITCQHAGLAFSDALFPEDNMTYGLSNIENVMTSLYNRTM